MLVFAAYAIRYFLGVVRRDASLVVGRHGQTGVRVRIE
jgi:hypothetical protein